MKRLLFIISILLQFTTSVYGQIISLKADVSPAFTTVYEDQTKVLKYVGPFTVLYFDSLGSRFMCELQDFNYYNSSYAIFNKWPIPFNLKISDMYTPNYNYVWFCGKIGNSGNGMYGWINPNFSLLYSQYMYAYSLSDMTELKKMTMANIGTNPPDLRMFAIGTTSPGHNTHILDLYHLSNPSLPYNYATVNSNEYLDNLELVGDRVVFATRDIDPNNTYVNLRVMETTNGLSNSSIDTKWRFLLPTDVDIYGDVFLKYLENDWFEVCYIKYSFKDGYVLCLHRIVLGDMLSGVNNTMICQEIPLEKGEFIQDLVYDRVERVLVLLMDKDNNHSVFLHTLPDNTVNYPVIRLESDIDDRYFSIDTLNSYSYCPARMYQAWGGIKCFEQRIGTGGSILNTCIHQNETKATSVDPIVIEGISNTLPRNVGSRTLYQDNEKQNLSGTISNCFIDETKPSNE